VKKPEPKAFVSSKGKTNKNPFFQKSKDHSFFTDTSNENAFFSPIIRPKLTIGRPDDEYEKEADNVADKVMRMPALNSQQIQKQANEEEEEEIQTKLISDQVSPLIQRQAEEEEEEALQPKLRIQKQVEEDAEEEVLQPKRANSNSPTSSELANQLQKSKGSGRQLPEKTHSEMNQAFGMDFSDVRVHTDSKSDQINSELNARAFTHGRNIYFNRNEFQPNTSSGKRLLAHELTHVVQQQNPAKIRNESGNLNQNISKLQSRQSQRVQRHLSIPAAVNEFKTKIGNPDLLGRGQFYWSYKLKLAIKNKYQNIIDTSWSGVEKGTLNVNLNRLLELSYDPKGETKKIKALLKNLKKLLAASTNPTVPDIKKIIGTGRYKSKSSGEVLFRKLWNDYQKTQSLPSFAPYARIDRLQGLATFEYIACWSAAQRVPKFFTTRGGFSVGSRSRNTKISGISMCGQVKRYKSNLAGSGKGDVIIYPKSIDSAINKIKTALDDGHLIHARILSGIYSGTTPYCKQEHSINIIGYDGNQFVFWDPGTNVSNEFGGGFGYLFYDNSGSKKRFTTAKNESELLVDKHGEHLAKNQHRYQVISVRTV